MKLKSGREVNAYKGVIGIDEKLRIFGGFDVSFEEAFIECPDYQEKEAWESWTAEEKSELADLMIARWVEYKAAVLKSK